MDERRDTPVVGTDASGIVLRIAEDRMQVLLSCDGEALQLPDLAERLLARLSELKIVVPPDRPALDAAIAEARAAAVPRIAGLPFVLGLDPVEPQDGRLEWTRDYFDTHYPVDPKTGAIDFHGRVGDPSVAAGDLLVRVIPTVAGAPGHDVFGRPLPVRAPVEPKVIPGANVTWDDEAGGYRSTSCGRVSFRDQKLTVDPVLQIRGDVGAHSGNVQHQGPVRIQGDVDAGYKVEATGDIEIGGMVYDAHVKCGGDLAIAGGVNGNTHATLESRGSLHARFILNARVRSGGDVVAEREIYQSDVEAGGEIRVPAGRIVGGQVTATRGITIGEAGSSSSPSTLLALKPDREMLSGLHTLKAQMAEAGEQIRALRQTVRQYRQQASLLSEAGKKKMAAAAVQLVRLEAWTAARQRESETILHQIADDQGAVIQILERIHPGVALKIHHGDYRCDTEMLGPILARLNRGTGEIDLSSPEDEAESAPPEPAGQPEQGSPPEDRDPSTTCGQPETGEEENATAP